MQRTTRGISVGLFDDSDTVEPARLLTDLSARESQRYRSMRHARRARQYLASRWLLRTHLSCWLAQEPRDIALETHQDGPPILIDLPCHIGLSHSGSLSLCIVAMHTCVGCDIERHRRRPSLRAIARQYFHPSEATQLDVLDDAHASTAFYRLWTLKEATLKARGRGIDCGLQAPRFDLNHPMTHTPTDTTAWTHLSHQLERAGAQYTLALAINSRHETLSAYEYSPGASARPAQELTDSRDHIDIAKRWANAGMP